MFVLSAYAPPTFLTPCLVWQTCQCDYTGRGAHMLGCFVDALNTDHALKMAHESKVKWFEMGRYPTWRAALREHCKMARAMQNGRGNKRWEAGRETYEALYEAFKDAPKYNAKGTAA